MILHEFFSKIDDTLLNSWITEGRQEDLHLDFKLVGGGEDLDRPDRKNLAIALSGFANSDGGVIVWGVEARRDASGVDAACALKPMNSARGLLSKLNSYTGSATSPTLGGVQHRLIASADSAGFIATYVPPSDAGPHMAKLGEDRYYKRSGDSFYKMEHFDIADMFGRRAQPNLELLLSRRIGSRTSSMGSRSAQIVIFATIRNRGRGLAKYPMLALKTISPLEVAKWGLDGNGRTGLPPRVRPPWHDGWHRFSGGVNDAIHPGTTLEVTQIEIEIAASDTELGDQNIEYELGCEGASLRRGTISLKGEELIHEAHTALREW